MSYRSKTGEELGRAPRFLRRFIASVQRADPDDCACPVCQLDWQSDLDEED
jgi:hypothetical protein